MIDVSKLKGQDIFRDKQGGLWRVTAIYRDPTVQMERIDWQAPQAHHQVSWPLAQSYNQRPTMFGVVDAPIFDGFERLEPVP